MSQASRPPPAVVGPVESGTRPVGAVDFQGATMIAPAGAAIEDPSAPNRGAPMSVSASETSGRPSSLERERLAGRYEILALVGSGGMGTVYRARDTELDEIVALKVMRPELLATPGILERFRREAKLSRRVTHRNVARVFDIGEDERQRFLTMEFIEGEALSATLAREGALPIGRCVAVAGSIAEGVASAHAAGVVHRDLKPDNVLLAPSGRVVVTDFGIARAVIAGVDGLGSSAGTDTLGVFVGTPAYMAPEQVKGSADIGPRADIYAFGALLYEMLTGRRAFPGDAPLAVATARLVEPVPDPLLVKPTLPAALADLCRRCLAKDPNDRPASMTEIATNLAAMPPAWWAESREGGSMAPPSRTPQPTPHTISSHGSPFAGGARAERTERVEKTVAVLPFRNSGAEADGFVAEELTDDLIDSLSMTHGLRVRARGAVLGYRGSVTDPREIGRELGVQVVVEGSVRRASGQVRISARLISVADGFQVWAKRFDRPEQEVLTVNDEVARAIAEALTLESGSGGRVAPSNPAVIDIYLRARHEHRRMGAKHQVQAAKLFEEALALAPDDPLVLAGLATTLARMSFFEGAAVLPRAREMAERALVRAPHLPEAHLALAAIASQAVDATGAMRSLRAALAAGPGLAEAHAAIGRLLGEAWALEEALHRLDTALSLAPDAIATRMELARLYALANRWHDVEAVLGNVGDQDGPGFWTIRTRLALWRGDEVLLEHMLERVPEHIDSRYARLVLHILRTREAPANLFDYAKEERTGGPRRLTFSLQLTTEVLCFCDKLEPALEAVERAIDAGLFDIGWMLHCPLLTELRKQPRFAHYEKQVRARADAVLAAYRA